MNREPALTLHLDLLQTPAFRRDLARCIHCGLCLTACPTYSVFATEMDSPRGRIALMRAVSEGRIGAADFQTTFSQHIQRCLACRACESACPSGVQYGALVETARIAVEHSRRPAWAERALRWLGVSQLMPYPRRLLWLAKAMWLYEKIGLQRLVRSLASWLPRPLRAMEAILPPLSWRHTDFRQPAAARGAPQGRVLFFSGCIQEAFLSEVNQATLRVLQRNGYEVVTPAGQTCCGAAHLHLGDEEGARALARRNLQAFLPALEGSVAIVCNAGGCGATLKEYVRLLADDPASAADAQRFSGAVQDVSEFLAAHLHTPPSQAVPRRAVYADSCHLRHAQKVVNQPRWLLNQVPGLQLVEMHTPERCCGSAGVYNIAQAAIAEQVLEAKMADIAATQPDLIVTTNTGCHMQLIAGARRAGLHAEVRHLVEVLDMAYPPDPQAPREK